MRDNIWNRVDAGWLRFCQMSTRRMRVCVAIDSTMKKIDLFFFLCFAVAICQMPQWFPQHLHVDCVWCTCNIVETIRNHFIAFRWENLTKCTALSFALQHRLRLWVRRQHAAKLFIRMMFNYIIKFYYYYDFAFERTSEITCHNLNV